MVIPNPSVNSEDEKKKKRIAIYPGFPELERSDVSIHPVYSKLSLAYRVVCRHRYHSSKLAQRKQFMKELKNFERMQPKALDGVRVHREFSQGILSHTIPTPRYMQKLTPDPLTSKQRMRVEEIISGRIGCTRQEASREAHSSGDGVGGYVAMSDGENLTKHQGWAVLLTPAFVDPLNCPSADKISHVVVCRHRYHWAKVAQRKQFMRELLSFEKIQSNALDGVRVHREFSQGILSHTIPPRRYIQKMTPESFTSKQRMRVEEIISGRATF